MSEPTIETFRALLGNEGFEMSDVRLAQAVETHRAQRPDIEALRAHPLSFLEPVLEPATALSWIERGGRP